jgi:hypothetical protein
VLHVTLQERAHRRPSKEYEQGDKYCVRCYLWKLIERYDKLAEVWEEDLQAVNQPQTYRAEERHHQKFGTVYHRNDPGTGGLPS